MGLGPKAHMTYAMGHGRLYYPIWHLLSKAEKDVAVDVMRARAHATMGSGKRNTGEKMSLAAAYICASKMHADHEFFGDLAFFSQEFGHPVCGAALQIERRTMKGGWIHRCKLGPPLTTAERGGKHKWSTQTPKIVFRVCALCQAYERARGHLSRIQKRI